MASGGDGRNLPLLTAEEVEERRPILLAGLQQYNDGYFFEVAELMRVAASERAEDDDALWLGLHGSVGGR